MKTAFGSPLPSRVRSPVIASVEVDLYTPGARVCPPKSPAMLIGAVDRPAASLYAMVKEACACCAGISPAYIAPFTVAGGVPGTKAVPGQTPRSPLIRLGPVLVTVLPAKTAKVPADPSSMGACAGGACAAARFAPIKQRVTAAPTRNALTLFVGFTDPHFTSLCFLLFFMT